VFIRVLVTENSFEHLTGILGTHYGVDLSGHQDRSRELAIPIIAMAETERTFTGQIT
jgi:hypothetical protein